MPTQLLQPVANLPTRRTALDLSRPRAILYHAPSERPAPAAL